MSVSASLLIFTLPCRAGRFIRRLVCPSVRDISEFRAVFALLLLPNRVHPVMFSLYINGAGRFFQLFKS